ncbi:MAG: hypothetical protein P3X24_001015 [bacterium]|nr:hypothetical protein [bacterium]
MHIETIHQFLRRAGFVWRRTRYAPAKRPDPQEYGDGVQWIFYRDPSVLTVSIHEGGKWLFPGTGAPNEFGEGAAEGTSVNIPLAPYTDDALGGRRSRR